MIKGNRRSKLFWIETKVNPLKGKNKRRGGGCGDSLDEGRHCWWRSFWSLLSKSEEWGEARRATNDVLGAPKFIGGSLNLKRQKSWRDFL
jgi:hypothetical protein